MGKTRFRKFQIEPRYAHKRSEGLRRVKHHPSSHLVVDLAIMKGVAVLPAPQFPPVVGEAASARVVRIVRFYAGCSLSGRRDELAALIGRGADDENNVTISTNCGMFALGVLAAAGCTHSLLQKKYVSGMAIAWLVQIGDDADAWRTSGEPTPGSLCWYSIPGKNDDHVEFVLDGGDHGGGGRANNEITVEHGQVATSLGRPLYKWLDVTALGLPDATAPSAPDGVA